LNRLADCVQPESEVAREFSKLIDTFLLGRATNIDLTRIGNWLRSWHNLEVILHPVFGNSCLLADALPVLSQLSALAFAATQSLDYLRTGKVSPKIWSTKQIHEAFQTAMRKDDVQLAIARPLIRLIDTACSIATSQVPSRTVQMPAVEPKDPISQ